jgi:hypothetical protein
VTGRRSRLRRFGRNRRHFVYVTFRIRVAARADPANRVGRLPFLDAMLRQEAPPLGKGQLSILFADEAGGQVNQQLRQSGAGPEQGAPQARDVNRHVSGLAWTESAAAEPAVEPWPEFKDELGGVKAVGGGACAGKAGEAHLLSTGVNVDQGQFVNAPFALDAAFAFTPVEIVAIQVPVVAFRIDPVLAQDLRPFGQQVGKTRLQRPSCRYGDEAPAVAFDGTSCRERGVRLPDRKPTRIAVSQRDLDERVGAPSSRRRLSSVSVAVMAGRGMDGSMVGALRCHVDDNRARRA